MHHQHGIILVTALLLLFTLTLIGLSALATSQLELRMSYNMSDTLHELQVTESALNEIEKKLAKEQPCQYSPLTKEQGKNPWREKIACTLTQSGIKINYVVEEFPDAICIKAKKGKLPGKYYRITAWPTIKNNEGVILQSTYAIDNPNGTCKKDTRETQTGRTSWRELN